MATKVKGILKGLRYISQIFDDQKEPEMQIGYPTDVKHVAHIGWEGPSTNNTPTWMRGFNSTTPEVSSGQFDSLGEDNKLSSEDIKRNGGGIKETLLQHIKSAGSGSSPTNSPRRSSDAPKHSRRYRSTDASTDSPSRDSPGSARHSRRHRNSINGKDLPSQDLPAVPKHSRRRKSKGSSGGGSIKALRSKDQNSLPDIHFTDMESGTGSGHGHGHGLIKSNENQLNSVLEKEGDRI